jgi:hypothetical protein
VRTDKSGTVHDRGEQMFASGCWMWYSHYHLHRQVWIQKFYWIVIPALTSLVFQHRSWKYQIIAF